MFAVPATALTPEQLAQRWRELAPVMPEEGRPELDEFGELILAPLPTNRHQRIAGWIGTRLQQTLGGEIGVFAISTRIGVRVPDMCWTPDASRFEDDPAVSAPEICVEVASPGNTQKWLLEKAAAYLAAGAVEVIVVELNGRLRYFGTAGERTASQYGVRLDLPG
ncbi:Uma2 family endonuclease [Aquabacterium sp. A7-Y]|uniref:Uma2 family endonuclease n=1 Tax=Aquabacterium sp. A7-Y TaxID=1349605 RepID=UPI00223D022A|nr:Uma2 family endonuclease [Aquabacterium sp. A7-Y]MCW7541826.1 Uma2 family endonuclease [Aquabacterium sp. A7-Y]